MLIVKCNTTPAHDAVKRYFQTAYKDIVDEHSLTRSEQSFAFVVSGDTGGFSGAHQGSRKTADLMIVPIIPNGEDDDDVEPPDDEFPLVAIEVGFSVKYACLIRDMKKWLEGSGGKTRAVIITSLAEDPVYMSKPVVQAPPIKQECPPAPEMPAPRRPYGPIMRDGHIQVGEITAFLEI